MIELRHLRYFMAVATELHFGRAADRLHIAQPPLSQQIRQLETAIGFQLFHRTKRQVQLTAAGTYFFADCQKIFSQLESAIQMGQQVSRGEAGQLVIGFVSSAAYNVLPSILRSVRAQIPSIRLELHELTSDQQLQWLHQGQMDIGFIRPPIEDQTLQQTIVWQEPLVVALPETHPLAHQSQLSLAALASEGFILFPRPQAPGLYDQIISLCQQAGFSPIVIQEAIQMQTIVSLVAAELGIAIVPVSIQHLQRTGVVYRPLLEPTPQATIALVYKPSSPPAVQRVLAIIAADQAADRLGKSAPIAPPA